MQELGIDPTQLHKVHESIGFALWHIQAFENTLVHYLIMVFKLSPGVASSEAYAIFDQTSKKTLGQLLSELRKYNDITPDLDQRLKRFLDERNWLVHRSRYENHTDLYTPVKLEFLFQRLESLTEEALNLNKTFCKLLELYLIDNDIVNKEQIEKKAQEVLNNWKNPIQA
jgi:hypothetical protein